MDKRKKLDTIDFGVSLRSVDSISELDRASKIKEWY